MPVFRDSSSANRTAEKGPLDGEGGISLTFLCSAHEQSGFEKARGEWNAIRRDGFSESELTSAGISLVVISAMAPVVEAQQGVGKAAPGTLVAPADALNSLVKMTESQMINLVKATREGGKWRVTRRDTSCCVCFLS
jgi:hypothetical protein